MFLEEISYNFQDLIPLYADNKGTVDLALNSVTGRWLKHILIKYYAIWGYVEHDEIELIRTPTEEMLADGLTKPLMRTKLKDFVCGLGLI